MAEIPIVGDLAERRARVLLGLERWSASGLGRGMPLDRVDRIVRLLLMVMKRPGLSRKALAEAFCLSERQVQADLEACRRALEGGGIVLIQYQQVKVKGIKREHGYRLAGEVDDGGLTVMIRHLDANGVVHEEAREEWWNVGDSAE